MADMKAMLTKKLGPLPAWGWGVVIGGGYLGYRLVSGKGMLPASAGAGESDADTSGMTAGGGSGTGSSGGYSDPSGSYAPTTPAEPIIPPLTPYESGKEQSLLEAYTSGEERGLTLNALPVSPLAPVFENTDPGETPTPTPQPGTPPTSEPIKIADPKPKQSSSKGWKIWGVHWKDVAKKRTSTNAGRANTAAYKKGQAANKAKRAAKTKKTGTSQAGFIKQKPKVLPPPHRNDIKKKVAAKPATKKKVIVHKPAPKKKATPKRKGK